MAVQAARELLPAVELSSSSGSHRLWAHRGRRNLVLALVHRDCPPCRRLLERLAGRRQEFSDQQAEALAIFDADPGQLPSPLPARWDDSGCLAGFGRPAVLVADRFGAIFLDAPAPDHNFPSPDELLKTLAFVESQCPECGAPEWEER